MNLALYVTPLCGYCLMVRRAIDRLGLDVEVRNVSRHAPWREELFAARGRGTVPVLRIENDDDVEWMGESRDIIRYLESLAAA